MTYQNKPHIQHASSCTDRERRKGAFATLLHAGNDFGTMLSNFLSSLCFSNTEMFFLIQMKGAL